MNLQPVAEPVRRSRPGLIAVSYVIFRNGPSVLLQRRGTTGFLDGYWATAAAGHVEPGESAVSCAVREIREELGLAVSAGHLLPLATVHRSDPGSEDRVDFFFLCTRWAGRPELQEPEKATDLRWFPLDALPPLVVPHERLVFEGLARGELPPLLILGFPPENDRPIGGQERGPGAAGPENRAARQRSRASGQD